MQNPLRHRQQFSVLFRLPFFHATHAIANLAFQTARLLLDPLKYPCTIGQQATVGRGSECWFLPRSCPQAAYGLYHALLPRYVQQSFVQIASYFRTSHLSQAR